MWEDTVQMFLSLQETKGPYVENKNVIASGGHSSSKRDESTGSRVRPKGLPRHFWKMEMSPSLFFVC